MISSAPLVSMDARPVTVARLRSLALAGLERMFDRDRALFVFRLRRTPSGVVREGWSRRYTAAALIGLAEEDAATAREVLGGRPPALVGHALMGEAGALGLGDVSLVLWAARASGEANRRPAVARLRELMSSRRPHPTVEVAWALAALQQEPDEAACEMRSELAARLLGAFSRESGLFAHVVAGRGLRSHVACFADQVYPIHALSLHASTSGDRVALDAALRCAGAICREQGGAGQWWWHYDTRTGEVIEGYPVYAVHQDSMAPMALFALHEAVGEERHRDSLRRGLTWLTSAPELDGGTLVDGEAGLIWRKVARREPRKLSRYLQAVATRVRPSARFKGLDRLFPPVAIDFEDRPYHLGWVLHAFPPRRAGWA